MPRPSIADRYLQALGVDRGAPTPAFLTTITQAHVATFPFSSIGPRLGDDLPLDADSLLDRIVVRRRGGYCFEQNGLLNEVLDDLGYSTRVLLARVILHGHPHPGLTHRVTLVDFGDQRVIADVGFGSLGPPRPVPLPGEGPLTDEGLDADRRFDIVEADPGEFHLRRHSDGQAVSLYRFELSRYGQSDCELGHFYSHRHPDASFVNNLVASRILADRVLSLRNLDYWIVTDSGQTPISITSAEQLMRVLRDDFGLDLSADECRRLHAELPTA